eukprot:m.151199 g.151199  ORF g.151199 m.151199 type:complete len:60 (-) comp17854_c0_seq4:15-194(-)
MWSVLASTHVADMLSYVPVVVDERGLPKFSLRLHGVCDKHDVHYLWCNGQYVGILRRMC